MWNAFFKEMEKRAFLIGTAVMGAATALDIGSRVKEQQSKLKLTPLKEQSNFQLQGTNQYQFEGGKHTDLKETTSPNSTLYG